MDAFTIAFSASALLVCIGTVGTVYTSGILPRCRYTKNGGMRFLRVGKLQLSFCLCKKSI